MKSKSRHSKNWAAEYVGSYVDPSAVPQDQKPVIAVIGRSNVGKSSFINSLTGQKGLARISANPGKTQTLNYYLVNESFFLVDMPGYGYAKVSKEQRVTWSAFSGMFLQKCENLLCLLILTDANIIPQDIDIRFINWCGEQGIPINIIRTKIDKSKPSELSNMEKLFFEALSAQWEDNPVLFRHSASKNLGTPEIRIAIERMCK
ncbi:MAG: ribosome biogenesis GTP-binding protein YihA/YsxC [Saprospiraceae bacterium]